MSILFTASEVSILFLFEVWREMERRELSCHSNLAPEKNTNIVLIAMAFSSIFIAFVIMVHFIRFSQP